MKTAVEWLVEELEMNILWTDKARKVAEQAKEMFEEQVIDAVEDGQRTDFYVKYYDAEQYYNETFKSE